MRLRLGAAPVTWTRAVEGRGRGRDATGYLVWSRWFPLFGHDIAGRRRHQPFPDATLTRKADEMMGGGGSGSLLSGPEQRESRWWAETRNETSGAIWKPELGIKD
jgi:hypothetical protein